MPPIWFWVGLALLAAIGARLISYARRGAADLSGPQR